MLRDSTLPRSVPFALALLPAMLLSGPELSAQLQATFVAKTKMVVSAFFSSTGAQSAEIPINTDLTGGKSISVINSAVATCKVGLTNGAGVLRATIDESATGQYFSSSFRAYSNVGIHETLLTLSSATPTDATLRATWTMNRSTSGASGTCGVDIGDDGSIEFAGSTTTVTKDLPITIDGAGLKISTRTSGYASASSSTRNVSYQSNLTLELLPPRTCLFFSHGAPCGPTLSGVNGFGYKVTLNVTGAAANGNGMVVFGMQRIELPLPGTACLLRVLPVVVFPVGFDSAGTLALTGTIPPVRPFSLPVQVGSFGSTLGTSNALTLIVP